MVATTKAGMSPARKYLRLGKLPSETRKPPTWRTGEDPLADVWKNIESMLELNPGMQATTTFNEWRRRYPGTVQAGPAAYNAA